jgi:hypothetical protein
VFGIFIIGFFHGFWKRDLLMSYGSSKSTSTAVGLSEAITAYTITSNTLTMPLGNGNVGRVSTAPSANFTVNLTGVPTTDGQVITVTIFVTQGATGYYPSAFQIDGNAQTIKWANSAAPTPTSSAGKIDIFTFSLVRLSSAWTVFGTGVLNMG